MLFKSRSDPVVKVASISKIYTKLITKGSVNNAWAPSNRSNLLSFSKHNGPPIFLLIKEIKNQWNYIKCHDHISRMKHLSDL